MDAEEEIKKRIFQQKVQESQQQRSQQQMIKSVMSKILDSKAMERLAILKSVKPEVASQLEMYLIQAYQMGQIKELITEEQLKMVLQKIGEKRDIKIRRM